MSVICVYCKDRNYNKLEKLLHCLTVFCSLCIKFS